MDDTGASEHPNVFGGTHVVEPARDREVRGGDPGGVTCFPTTLLVVVLVLAVIAVAWHLHQMSVDAAAAAAALERAQGAVAGLGVIKLPQKVVVPSLGALAAKLGFASGSSPGTV